MLSLEKTGPSTKWISGISKNCMFISIKISTLKKSKLIRQPYVAPKYNLSFNVLILLKARLHSSLTVQTCP